MGRRICSAQVADEEGSFQNLVWDFAPESHSLGDEMAMTGKALLTAPGSDDIWIRAETL